MVFFLGPLPPPVHGFSAINLKMLTRLLEKTDVRVFNSAPAAKTENSMANTKWQSVSRMLHSLKSLLAFFFLALVKRPDAMYVGLSGGVGQLFDSLCILAARLVGANIYIHHHSFVYVNQVKSYNRFCLWAAGRACHIALCDVMADKLASTYGIPEARIFILSNAAFLAEKMPLHGSAKPAQETLTLGFLSNIIVEKGIVEFFDVVASLTQQGLRVKGVVAGPVDPALKEMFSSLLADQHEIEYVGPVYDEKKDDYFQRIDLLLFPTKYRNEAEPLTILEALREGVPVLAAGRGCIRSMISARSGQVFPEIDHFVADASEYIKAILTGTVSLPALSESASRQFCIMHGTHAARLDDLLERIVAPKSLPKPLQA
jgi:glycosyltransferase involved in cell wall biosynthesis